MGMDFYVMKRKKLQQLCKKQGIPANLGNIEMANRLTFLLEIQKVKKVSFNPANEIFFFAATPNYSYSGPKKKSVQQRKSRVKQASKKKHVQLAENARELKLSVIPVRLTRSGAHKMQEGNAKAVCLPPEVKFSEGVGGETVSSGGLIHRQLRSRMVVCKYGGDSMVSRKKTNEDSVVVRIGVEPEKIQEQFKANVTKVKALAL